jgi:hypothetical protein
MPSNKSFGLALLLIASGLSGLSNAEAASQSSTAEKIHEAQQLLENMTYDQKMSDDQVQRIKHIQSLLDSVTDSTDRNQSEILLEANPRCRMD